MIKMMYTRCMGIYKFGNDTYPRRIRHRSNLGHIFREKKCVLWAGKYCYSSVHKWHLLQKIPNLQPLWNQMAKQLIEILVILGKQ